MGLIGAAAVLAAPVLAAAQPQDLFYERTVISAAGERCGLFAPAVSAQLAASAAQARGAALRAGANARDLQALERDARDRAAGVDCRSPAVAKTKAQIDNAFGGYAKVTRMSYPGDVAGWQADRNITRDARWRLSQDATFSGGRMTFGLAGREAPGSLVAVAEFAGGAAPYSARLLIRDSGRTMGPYLLRGTGGALASRLPPRSVTRAYLAEVRTAAPAELLPRDGKGGWAFRFPAAAASALSGLDPREAVAVEFLFRGERVVTAYVEVGDFAAGQAFLKLASR